MRLVKRLPGTSLGDVGALHVVRLQIETKAINFRLCPWKRLQIVMYRIPSAVKLLPTFGDGEVHGDLGARGGRVVRGKADVSSSVRNLR